MSNIEWGPAIKVDGTRPDWLGTAAFQWQGTYNAGGDDWHAVRVFPPLNWPGISAIRLFAEHPHYRQPIDWSAPIEAVHEDGRVLPVVAFSTRRMDYCLVPVDGVLRYFDREAGTARSEDNPWRIRNVAAKPVRTAAEMLERLEALARRMALGTDSILEQYDAETTGLGRDYTEARAIVAEMTPPVDPDLIEARSIAADTPDDGCAWVEDDDLRAGKADNHVTIRIALAAIKRGRELERGA